MRVIDKRLEELLNDLLELAHGDVDLVESAFRQADRARPGKASLADIVNIIQKAQADDSGVPGGASRPVQAGGIAAAV